MSYEEDYVNEEDEIEEGCCHGCSKEIIGPGLTICPESGEEVKANCWIEYSFCRDCCKDALNNGDCEGSCEEDFVEEYRKLRFIEICNTEKLIKYDEESYTNAEKSILITIGKIEDKFEEIDTRTVDDRNRLTLGELLKGSKRVRLYKNDRGEFLLQPVVEIPASEAWLFQNKEAFESVKKGLKDASVGKILKLNLKDL